MFGLEDFVAGWLGGIAGLVVGHPLDTVKVRQQALYASFYHTVRRTYKHEGFVGFYKGFLAPFLTIGPTNAVFFQVYSVLLNVIQKQPHKERVDINEPHWIRNVVIAGGIAGFAQVVVTCPAELVKIVLQTKTTSDAHWEAHYVAPYNSTREAIVGIYKEFGVRGFFRGLVPMIWRDTPTSGVYMVTYELLLPRGDAYSVWQQLLAGGFAGMASWSVVIPFDVVKTKLQSDNPKNPEYKGMIDCFIKLYKSKGPAVFTQGFVLCTLRAFPVNAAILCGYETVMKLIT